MKKTKFMVIFLMIMGFGLAISSCGGDNDDNNESGTEVENSDPVSRLVGTWTGIDSYGMQCKYTFKSNGTGTGTSSNSYVTNNWTFTYVIEGNKIKCGGINKYYGQGESGEDYVSMTFILNGTTLTNEWGTATFKKQ